MLARDDGVAALEVLDGFRAGRVFRHGDKGLPQFEWVNQESARAGVCNGNLNGG
jgi:hypothetical protein